MTGLLEDDVDPDPIRQFQAWHADAGRPEEVALATSSSDGSRSARMVLLKAADEMAARDDRLHDRLRYRRSGDGWVIERLSR